MVQITADGNTLFVGSRERVLMRKRWLVLLVVLLLLSACTAEGIETKNPSLGEVSMQEESSNLNLIKTPTAAQIAEEQRSYNEKCAEILSAKKNRPGRNALCYTKLWIRRPHGRIYA